MSALTEFITARLDETEHIARAADPNPWFATNYKPELHDVCADRRTDPTADPDGDWTIARHLAPTDALHVAAHDPASMLATVAALRSVAALHQPDSPPDPRPGYSTSKCTTCAEETQDDTEDGWMTSSIGTDWPCPTLRAVAGIWSRHPDYDEAAWTP